MSDVHKHIWVDVPDTYRGPATRQCSVCRIFNADQ